jgi:hypothetical protein
VLLQRRRAVVDPRAQALVDVGRQARRVGLEPGDLGRQPVALPVVDGGLDRVELAREVRRALGRDQVRVVAAAADGHGREEAAQERDEVGEGGAAHAY